MTLTLEDGTGGDALITLQQFKDYCDDVGYDYSTFDDEDDIEPAIRRGSNFISTSRMYKGTRIGGRAQVQAFPRSGVITPEGWSVDATSIPREARDATAEATWYELNNPNGLLPSVIMTDRVTQEQVGPISVTYAAANNDANAAKPVLTIVETLLAPLVDRSTSFVTARANRG